MDMAKDLAASGYVPEFLRFHSYPEENRFPMVMVCPETGDRRYVIDVGDELGLRHLKLLDIIHFVTEHVPEHHRVVVPLFPEASE